MGEEEIADFQKNTFDYYDPQIILLDMTLKSQKKGSFEGDTFTDRGRNSALLTINIVIRRAFIVMVGFVYILKYFP
jgi:hypothetical protein